MRDVFLCIKLFVFYRKIGIVLLLTLESANSLIKQSNPIVYDLLLCMFFNGFKIKFFVTTLNFQQKVSSLGEYFYGFSFEIKELLYCIF